MFQLLNKKTKAKMATHSRFCIFFISREVTQTLSSPTQMRLSGVIKRAVEGTGISWRQGVLHRQTRATGLPESVTLLKSTFKPRLSQFKSHLQAVARLHVT